MICFVCKMVPKNFFANPMSFELDLLNINKQIDALKSLLKDDSTVMPKIASLEEELGKRIENIYSNLSSINKVEIARHPNRPHGLDYINHMFGEDFFEIRGDRCFGEDQAIIAGVGVFRGHRVMAIAHEKGHDLETRKAHNFGMPMPEGYRKAKRAMEIAEELQIPILCLIDTAGAYPGIESEERGQGYVLAECQAVGLRVKVPILSIIIGEGGSGGAIAIGVANKVLMLEHSIYSIISPEGCASILFKTRDKQQIGIVSDKLKLTAQALYEYRLIDGIVKEPVGGAHKDREESMHITEDAIEEFLNEFKDQDMYYFFWQQRQIKYESITRRYSKAI
jgi:acetyl-CoA carboxylase carboxyl transferase subunit alpha